MVDPMTIEPLKQDSERVDDHTKAAIQIGLDQWERGQVVTIEQSNLNLKKFTQAWQKLQAEISPA